MTDQTLLALVRVAHHVSQMNPYTIGGGCRFCTPEAADDEGQRYRRNVNRMHEGSCVWIMALGLVPRRLDKEDGVPREVADAAIASQIEEPKR